MIVQIFLLLSIARNATPRRHRESSSGESIENLLYYQDCKHTTAPPSSTVSSPKIERLSDSRPSCPYPKMCCAMSCNNAPCVSEQLNSYGNQMHPNLQPYPRMQKQRQLYEQPQVLRTRKKKIRPSAPMVNGRRDFGFTKDNIKSLISQDEDIRKILKDLVRVTMQKVDLQEMIKSRRMAFIATSTEGTTLAEIAENSEYEVDL
ncbi:uncharacterized protein LOC132902162 [Amyelois transitella]|uniref:uncharacterized protein LOC132902162 n=1 Tax=Amyelois transitella TaxID=680683 RepID=UPI002990300E|nr:uncharacterized protein LOC132902162 [Amyelois transitella]